MRCSKCGAEFDGSFCPVCLSPAQEDAPPVANRCPRCGHVVTRNYCTFCGLQRGASQPVYHYPYPFQARKSEDMGKILSISWMAYFGIFIVAVIGYVGLLWASASLVIPGILSESCEDCKALLLIIIPQPIPILEPFGGIPFLIYYILVVTVISSCFFWLFFKDIPTAMSDFKRALKKGWFSSPPKSALLKIGQLFAFGIFFNLAYSLIVLIFLGEGVLPDETAIQPTWYFLSLIAAAAVWEEIISRTLLIGIPLFVIALVRRRQIDSPLRYFVGGGFKMGVLEITFLFFSAVWFGLAHTFSSGPWVFPPLFVGGLILGFLFLWKGIVASILFHFIWNYNIAFNYVASLSDNTALLVVGVSFTLFVAFVGMIYAISFLMTAFRKVQTEAKTLEQDQHQPGEVPRTSPQFGYECPRCGWREAAFKDGSFKCLRCGLIT